MGGGYSHWKVVQGCAVVMTPFFQVSRRSLAGSLVCQFYVPPIFNLKKKIAFLACFAQNFISLEANFHSQDPSIFKEKSAP